MIKAGPKVFSQAAHLLAHRSSRCASRPLLVCQIAEGCVKVFLKQTDGLTTLCLQVGGGCCIRVMGTAACGRSTAPARPAMQGQRGGTRCLLYWPLGSRLQGSERTGASLPATEAAAGSSAATLADRWARWLIPPRAAGCGRRAPQGAVGLLPGAGPAEHGPGPRPPGKRLWLHVGMGEGRGLLEGCKLVDE